MRKKVLNDEIDIIEILTEILKNKSKIILITIISAILTFGYYSIKKPSFKAITKINSISIFKESLYTPYNSYIDFLENNRKIKNSIKTEESHSLDKGHSLDKSNEIKLQKINKTYLLDLFLAKLEDDQILINAINKFEIIDKNKFKNEELYSEAIEKLALSIKLFPSKVDGKKNNYIKTYWTIEFNTHDPNKWIKVLKYINEKINNDIRLLLINEFNIYKKSKEQIKKFKIIDLNDQITNAKENYKLETKRRLIFLEEQATIARELDIADNTLDDQNFYTASKIIANIQTENSYFMRGYKMIEKEIELIKSRSDKSIFIENLNELEMSKKTLIQNKELDRIENLLLKTPIGKPKNFISAEIAFISTKFEPSMVLIKLIIFSLIIGLIIGVIYVLIDNNLKLKK